MEAGDTVNGEYFFLCCSSAYYDIPALLAITLPFESDQQQRSTPVRNRHHHHHHHHHFLLFLFSAQSSDLISMPTLFSVMFKILNFFSPPNDPISFL
jgi:hypothetical protein